MTPALVVRLAWDSDFLGYEVGELGVSAIERGISFARARGFRLLYLKVPSQAVEAFRLALDLGGVRVGTRQVYGAAVSSVHHAPAAGFVLAGPKDFLKLLPLALEASKSSRFRVDPRLGPEVCDRLYGVWLERSLSGAIADEVWMLRVGEAVAGLVTLKRGETKGDSVQISLLSLAPQFQGQGKGRLLVEKALAATRGWGEARCEVVTQGENDRAIRLYERAGFGCQSEESWFHFWL